jgi:hypothetical protein
MESNPGRDLPAQRADERAGVDVRQRISEPTSRGSQWQHEFARPVNPEPARSNQSPSLSVLVPRRRPLIHPSRDRSGARRQPGRHLDDEMMRQGQVQPEEPGRPAEPAVHPAHPRNRRDIGWVAAGFA